MKPTVVRVSVVAVLMVAMMGLGHRIPGALAHDDEQDDFPVVYAAKVLCPIGLTTIINIHNPHGKEVRFRKKGIPLGPGQTPTPPAGEPVHESLNPDWALQMHCQDLSELGAFGLSGFGDLIIESKRELDVWAVYLTGGIEGSPFVDTEVVRVPSSKVKNNNDDDDSDDSVSKPTSR